MITCKLFMKYIPVLVRCTKYKPSSDHLNVRVQVKCLLRDSGYLYIINDTRLMSVTLFLCVEEVFYSFDSGSVCLGTRSVNTPTYWLFGGS